MANERETLVETCFQHAGLLKLTNPMYRDCVDGLLRWMLKSDGLSSSLENDITTKTLNLKRRITAVVFTRQAGVIAGIEEVLFLFGRYPAISVENHLEDGQFVEKGTTILSFSVEIADLLALERTILNVIGRMSGIATQTHHLVSLTQGTSAHIAGTRKTPWMLLDKKAIACGGGLTHRLSLSDSVLIKDNHLLGLHQPTPETAIQKAVEIMIAAAPAYFELEVESLAQANIALDTFKQAVQRPTLIMLLDNFEPAQVADFIRDVAKDSIYPEVLFEASGDITEETLPQWAETGVDVITLGALTHSSKNFNISMSLT